MHDVYTQRTQLYGAELCFRRMRPVEMKISINKCKYYFVLFFTLKTVNDEKTFRFTYEIMLENILLAICFFVQEPCGPQ